MIRHQRERHCMGLYLNIHTCHQHYSFIAIYLHLEWHPDKNIGKYRTTVQNRIVVCWQNFHFWLEQLQTLIPAPGTSLFRFASIHEAKVKEFSICTYKETQCTVACRENLKFYLMMNQPRNLCSTMDAVRNSTVLCRKLSKHMLSGNLFNSLHLFRTAHPSLINDTYTAQTRQTIFKLF